MNNIIVGNKNSVGKAALKLQAWQSSDEINSFSTLPKLYSAIKDLSLVVTRY